MARLKKMPPVQDEDLLSLDEKAELLLEAEQQVLLDRKSAAKKAFLAAARRAEKTKDDPTEDMLSYHVVLPRFCTHVSIDGVLYYHEQTYTFSRRQIDSIRDIVANAWKHEEAAFGDRDPNAYMRKRSQVPGATTRVNFNSFASV